MNKETVAALMEAQRAIRTAAEALDGGVLDRRADKALYRLDQDLRELLGDEDVSGAYPGPGWHRG